MVGVPGRTVNVSEAEAFPSPTEFVAVMYKVPVVLFANKVERSGGEVPPPEGPVAKSLFPAVTGSSRIPKRLGGSGNAVIAKLLDARPSPADTL